MLQLTADVHGAAVVTEQARRHVCLSILAPSASRHEVWGEPLDCAEIG